MTSQAGKADESVSSMPNQRSSELFQEAVRRLPGGVSSPVRAFKAVGGQPFFVDRADGAWIQDVDGTRYVDLVLAYGPLILGHRHPAVLAALHATLERGTAFGAPTADEVELARRIQDAFPSIGMVRFVTSGTEAVMSAVRVARAFTGRSGIVKFAGSYHGHADQFLVAAGSGLATAGQPDSPGVPAGATADIFVVPDNDHRALETLLLRAGEQIAAIVVEPVMGNYGVILPSNGWLAELRRLADAYGCLLIFDEVITGFRLAYGGAQEWSGVRADLTCLGKIIGGGLPVGAYGGRSDIMGLVAPAGPVYQAGTLAGNPLAIQAGIATLDVLRATNPYDVLAKRTTRLFDGWQQAASDLGVPVQGNHVASFGTLFFSGSPITRSTEAGKADRAAFAVFHRSLIERGVFLAPSQFEALFLSIAHDDDIVDRLIEAGRGALSDVARKIR